MAQAFPFTYIACPCTSIDSPASGLDSRRVSRNVSQETPAEDADENTFDPHHPRANFNLYSYDHLLYCDECHQIRCPRCWTEEIMNWYCPSCLFEVPSSVVKSDGNRCTRNCYNCPICTVPLEIKALDQASDSHLAPGESSGPTGPYLLSCSYCDWSSLDVGIELSKPNKITEQLNRIRKRNRNGSPKRESSLASLPEATSSRENLEVEAPQNRDDLFSNLTNFYKTQLSGSSGANPSNPFGDSNYGSPSNLARIMSMYGGSLPAALKKAREKPQPMREALSPAEGLSLSSAGDEHAVIQNLRSMELDGTSSADQRVSHPYNQDSRFLNELWPVATLLRTRRSKRCRACRQILLRPEPKLSSTKYKIRLLALNHIPRLSLRPFSSPSAPSTSVSTSASAQSKPAASFDYAHIRPFLPIQFTLTLTNPLFVPVKVTLATPATTPGRVESKVTILAPSFEVGATGGDVWDEALESSQMPSRRPLGEEERQPEAGKIWERGRNWTSVIVEVVPGSLSPRKSSMSLTAAVNKRTEAKVGMEEEDEMDQGLVEDEDILEIPVFVRLEWEAEIAEAEGGKEKGGKEARELAFWSVLGAGRIADS